MKVLLIYNESGIEGKGNIDLFSVYRELRKLGHIPVVITRKDQEQNPDGNVRQLLPSPMRAFFVLPILVLKVKEIIKKENPDVIVAEGGWYIPTLLSFANRKDVPVVFIFRGLVLEVLASFHAKSFMIRTAAKVFIHLNYRIFRKSRFLVGTNASLCKFYEGKLGKKVELVGTHLLDLDYFRPLTKDERVSVRQRFSIAQDKTAILYSGAIEEWHLPYLKDLADTVHRLAEENNPVLFVLMGWGSRKKEFLSYLEGKGNKFFFSVMPWLEHEQVPKVIAACDICIDPYLRPYPMNHAPAGKLIEYMACGKCVITTKGYSNEEFLNEENGIIIDGTTNDLYMKLKSIITSTERIEILGKRARQTISTRFVPLNKPEMFEKYLRNVLRVNSTE